MSRDMKWLETTALDYLRATTTRTSRPTVRLHDQTYHVLSMSSARQYNESG